MSVRLGRHPIYGDVAMVRLLDGERYYWFVDEHGSVAMMPAFVVEEDIEVTEESD